MGLKRVQSQLALTMMIGLGVKALAVEPMPIEE
jgi:hypothetical protein